MAYHENSITMVGNLTDNPELRFTGSGSAVCSFRIAANRRWTGRDGQQQEETTFMAVNVWRDMAENIAESLKKGDRVVVIGRLKVRSYDDRDGVTKWVTEIEADEVAPSLRWARASVEKSNRPSGGGNQGGNQGGGNQGGNQGGNTGGYGGGNQGGGGGGGNSGYSAPPPSEDVPF